MYRFLDAWPHLFPSRLAAGKYISLVVDTEEKLASFLRTLKSATWVAVDTEADSLHAYPEKVCLIQISTTEGDRLIDPLVGLDLKPFLRGLSGHELIMHGADYDLRLLRKHHEFVPTAIFDTMLAARLLGDRQFGLRDLVQKYLGVKLEKGAQKANWAVRPLTPRMESYARNDTRHLKPLADRLRDELQRVGRLGWHREFCAQLIAESSQPTVRNAEAWRVKGSHALTKPGLAVLRELWRWRESEAIHANRPPFFVASHEALIHVTVAAINSQPIDPLLPRHLSQRRRASLLKAVERGLALAPTEYPSLLRNTGRRISDTERRRFLELQRCRDARAHVLGIDPTLIASRSTLSDLAHNWERNSAALMNWQREILDACQPS